MTGFEISERQTNGLKPAVEDLRSNDPDRNAKGEVYLRTILEDAAEQSDPKTAWHGIRLCLQKVHSATPSELYFWLGEPPQEPNPGEIESDDEKYMPPRIYSDVAAMIIEYIHSDAGDQVEKVFHDDLGDHEVLRFNFSNGKTFQIDIKEVEPTAIDESQGVDPELN